MKDSQFMAGVEVFKDFIRWCISFFLAWFVPNGLNFIMSFFMDKNIKVDESMVVLLIFFFKYLDYWYHRYRKMEHPELSGKSLGLFGV